MDWQHKHSYFILLICGLGLISPAVQAAGPALHDISISNTDENLIIHLSLEGAFSEKIKRTVLSGKPTSFAFIIQLNRVRDLWLDEKIAQIDVVHTIKYDNVKKEFIVRRSWKNNEAELTPSFEEAQKWMNRVEDLKIIPLGRMEKGAQYQLRTKAEVSKKTLPLNLHYVLFFISFWDEETDWYIIDFTY